MSDDPKAKCDQARVVRRANHSILTKLVKEVDEIIGIDPVTAEGTVQLKVILKQRAENVTARIIDYKCKIDDALKQNTGSNITANITLPR